MSSKNGKAKAVRYIWDYAYDEVIIVVEEDLSDA